MHSSILLGARSRRLLLLAPILGGALAVEATGCAAESPTARRDADASPAATQGSSGGGSSQSSGGTGAGTAATAGTSSAGSAGTMGGSSGTTGETSGGTAGSTATTPVDCAPIAAAGFELCETGTDYCGAVFVDGAGCTEVCAAAGLACEVAYENLDGSCGPDQARPTLACDSAHLSDYCLCRGAPSETPGAAGAGGAGAGAPDCNDLGDPVIEVAKTGSPDFMTIQAAINSLSKSNTTPTVIRIAPGTYSEKLVVDRPYVTLCGQQDQAAATILSYGDNANTPNGNGGTIGTSGSASTNISASHVSAENLTFKNSTALGGSQAVALLVTGTEVQFRSCRFSSYQDTLYVKGGTQYFKDCYIEGSVDFIFGGATAVFDACTIHNAAGGTAITAPSTDQAVPFGIVFLGGEVTAAASVSAGSVALGRNWQAYGATAYLGTVLGAHIKAVGWVPMGANTLATARFAEYQTTGPGANPEQRADESSQLSAGEAAAYTVENLFETWTPSFSE